MATVRILRSTTAGTAPASLVSGQIAINEGDGKLFYRNSAGAVTQLPTGGAPEVLEYTSAANFPATGSAAALYLDKDRGRVFRWETNVYVEMGPVGGGVGPLWVDAPLATESPGLNGQVAYDNNYFYVRTTGGWKRAPVVAFVPDGAVLAEDGTYLVTESGSPLIL